MTENYKKGEKKIFFFGRNWIFDFVLTSFNIASLKDATKWTRLGLQKTLIVFVIDLKIKELGQASQFSPVQVLPALPYTYILT